MQMRRRPGRHRDQALSACRWTTRGCTTRRCFDLRCCFKKTTIAHKHRHKDTHTDSLLCWNCLSLPNELQKKAADKAGGACCVQNRQSLASKKAIQQTNKQTNKLSHKHTRTHALLSVQKANRSKPRTSKQQIQQQQQHIHSVIHSSIKQKASKPLESKSAALWC